MASWTESLGDGFKGMASEKLLPMAKYFTRTLNTYPAQHRLNNCIGLSVGLWIGNELMNIVCAQKLDGTPVKEKSVPKILRPLYNLMPYKRYSDEPSDRWTFIARGALTAGFGAAGAIAGSWNYFKTTGVVDKNENMKSHHTDFGLTDDDVKPENMSEAIFKSLSDEKRGAFTKWMNSNGIDSHTLNASWAISKAYQAPTGLTAIPGSASGMSMLPFFNYGMSLGARFTFGVNRQIAMPGLGKLFTNSHTELPFGFANSIDRISRYIARNVDVVGMQTDEAGALKALDRKVSKLLKNALGPVLNGAVTEEHIKNIKSDLYAAAKVLENAKTIHDNKTGIDKTAADQIAAQMNKMLQGTELNTLLQKNGVDVTQADFSKRGIFGWVADKVFHADLSKFTQDFQQAFAFGKAAGVYK